MSISYCVVSECTNYLSQPQMEDGKPVDPAYEVNIASKNLYVPTVWKQLPLSCCGTSVKPYNDKVYPHFDSKLTYGYQNRL